MIDLWKVEQSPECRKEPKFGALDTWTKKKGISQKELHEPFRSIRAQTKAKVGDCDRSRCH